MGMTTRKRLTFGEQLKNLRLQQDCSLTEFARRIGISAANLCDLERGRKTPSPRRALAIAKILRIKPDGLLALTIEEILRKENVRFKVSLEPVAVRKPLAKQFGRLNPAHGFKIVVVEDNARDLELLVRAFEKNGVSRQQIDVLRDGEEALSYFFDKNGAKRRHENGLPKIVLLDLKLPKVNGIAVLAKLKEHPQTREMPIVILTSSTQELDASESYRLGVNSYVVKPVSFVAFTAAIRTLQSYWLNVNRIPGPHFQTKEGRRERY